MSEVIRIPKDAKYYQLQCGYCEMKLISADKAALMPELKRHIQGECSIHPLRKALHLIREALYTQRPDFVAMAAFMDDFNKSTPPNRSPMVSRPKSSLYTFAKYSFTTLVIAYGLNGLPIFSSILGVSLESP